MSSDQQQFGVQQSVRAREDRRRATSRQAFTLIEVLVVLSVLGILMGVVALNLRGFQRPALSDARVLAGAIKAARSAAVASTGAVQVRLDHSTRTFSARKARSCAATSWTDLPASTTVELNPRVVLVSPGAPTAWMVCFDSRGVADAAREVRLRDENGSAVYTVAVFLGGAVQVAP